MLEERTAPSTGVKGELGGIPLAGSPLGTGLGGVRPMAGSTPDVRESPTRWQVTTCGA